MVEYPVLRRFEKLKNKVLKIKKEPYVFQLILVEISNIMKNERTENDIICPC